MTTPTILVLGGTGKTGRRIATQLAAAGVDVRTAARRGADVDFDWHDASTHELALKGVDALYLVPPAQRLDFAPAVTAFLDQAEAAGVRHVTYLSARGVDQAPAEVPLRAVELDLASRSQLTHTVLRPGWFLQNFDEYLFLPTGGRFAAPAGDGAEAFVHADDIADVAVATLLDPAAHAGQGYTLSGPEALTFADVAAHLSAAVGQDITYVDQDRDGWIADQIAADFPPDYAGMLGSLLGDVLRHSYGAAVTDDIERVTGHPARGIDAYVSDPNAIATWQRAID